MPDHLPMGQTWKKPAATAPVRWYYWRAWLPDGDVVDQFNINGHQNRVSGLLASAPPFRVAWVTFSMARAKACWDQGIPAVPLVKKQEQEKIMADLTSPDGRMITPCCEGEANVFFGKAVGEPDRAIYELVTYILEHPLVRVTVDKFGRVKTTKQQQPQILGPTNEPLVLGKFRLDKEFELTRRGPGYSVPVDRKD